MNKKQECYGNCTVKLEAAVVLISDVLEEHHQDPGELFRKLQLWIGEELMRRALIIEKRGIEEQKINNN